MNPYTQTPHKRKVICFFFLLPACYLENLNAHETSAMILETYFLSMTPPSLYPLKTILCFLWTEEHKHPEVAAVSLSLSLSLVSVKRVVQSNGQLCLCVMFRAALKWSLVHTRVCFLPCLSTHLCEVHRCLCSASITHYNGQPVLKQKSADFRINIVNFMISIN